ncbi:MULTISPECIES: hypothetical protein [Chitinophaga]|jgi:hypothetical protein|uniref:Uncharacterized protein n=1 Tax=Chitinophaga sancti TaxID=1004 RepID=A0A1K1SFQ0_9BACT|nr:MULTISPECIES: hypothetical protein [Chitinophaga]OMP75291.1 hypothetical protein BW716_30905 [[Flexibacter] sp. ATCC 35208]WQD60016.1 hypothetical protein U0033_19185 [Chitinophaga sancti]WQG87854.1 hypothetical protein SR876_23280 [Chitinophaga sancti]SFW82733.1 hypothetical protein SAMN05661012_05303 [Chitinophaga sancti]
MTKLTRQVFDIPADIMLDVCSLICEHELEHTIMEVDEDEDTISLELQYSKQDRKVIHKIEDMIADNSDEEGDDDEEDDDDQDE